ncbi:hypothetical protein [Mesorhizobium sp. B2-8-3]|uniref:hypothetical protein n=1 Tax=Mesorhizobium sp. B2-8-3 TaxID=2589905 RepID=UPI0015E2C4C8|nr:hypothetical protein [Mesorhizobium sp. B2-8-3]
MHARAGFHALDQPVEHHDAMAAADEFGMHGERVDAALAVLERILEVTHQISSMSGGFE